MHEGCADCSFCCSPLLACLLHPEPLPGLFEQLNTCTLLHLGIKWCWSEVLIRDVDAQICNKLGRGPRGWGGGQLGPYGASSAEDIHRLRITERGWECRRSSHACAELFGLSQSTNGGYAGRASKGLRRAAAEAQQGQQLRAGANLHGRLKLSRECWGGGGRGAERAARGESSQSTHRGCAGGESRRPKRVAAVAPKGASSSGRLRAGAIHSEMAAASMRDSSAPAKAASTCRHAPSDVQSCILLTHMEPPADHLHRSHLGTQALADPRSLEVHKRCDRSLHFHRTYQRHDRWSIDVAKYRLRQQPAANEVWTF